MRILAPRRRFVSAGATCVAVALLLSAPARAEEQHELTSYERARVREAALELGLPPELDPSPEGKLVEAVDVRVLDVFDDTDPVPNFVNVFHATTRERIVRRELLFQVGERFDPDRANESARKLRKLRQLSLVVVVAFPGTAPDRVRVLVLVKDVWSLRLNYDHELSSDQSLNYLLLNLAEENLLGTHTTLGGLFTLTPGTYSFGVMGGRRRIFGSDIDWSLLATVIYGRATGKAEGATGAFVYGAPFASIDSKWAWGTGVAFSHGTYRVYENGHVARYDAPGTPEKDEIPVDYRSEQLVGGYEVTRSYGSLFKLDVTAGAEVNRDYFHWLPPAGTSPQAQREFRDAWIAVSDTRASPFVQLFQHEEVYLRTSDLETLSLEENYALGLASLLRVYPASRAVASSRDMIGVLAGASYTLALGDGLLRVWGSNRVELEKNGRHDADAFGRLRLALPRTPVGRLVLDGIARSRYEDYLHGRFELGGDTRLRGYPPGGFKNALLGKSVGVVNAELRSRPLGLLGIAAGLVAFYDAGDAAERMSKLSFKQSAGIGVRVVLPQFSRMVLRLDWAFPFTPVDPIKTFPGAVFFTFDQAFLMPVLEAPTVMKPTL